VARADRVLARHARGTTTAIADRAHAAAARLADHRRWHPPMSPPFDPSSA
jgi:hypothetical protein